MRSVADDLREEDIDALQGLSVDERIRLVLRLGERDVQVFMSANAVDRATALAVLRRSARAGRTYSKCADDP